MAKIILLILLLWNLTLNGQTATFRWNGELCEYESTFDSLKVSRDQLVSAYSLTWSNNFRIRNTPSVFEIEDIKRLNFDSLESEYKTKKSEILILSLPKGEIWEQLRQEQLKEIEQVYQICKASYIAFLKGKYSQLNHLYKKDSCLTFYSNAVSKGGESLLKAWEYLTTQQANNNCCPERVWEDYHKKRNSPERDLYAKISILTFGWWNCANKHIEYFDSQKALLEFKKLFSSSKEIYCEEP